ncbi:collagen-like protein, partial [Bacillus sp. JJ1764]
GATGATGAAGGLSQYGYIYNLGAQVVPIEADVIFDSNGIITPGITHAPGTSQILVTTPGDYEVTFSVSGVEPNQFSLFLN